MLPRARPAPTAHPPAAPVVRPDDDGRVRRATPPRGGRVSRWLASASAALLLVACGDSSPDAAEETSPTSTSTATADDTGGGGDAATGDVTVQVLTHESFALTPDVVTAFEEASGITVELLAGGDAGAVVNQTILTAGNPQGDVLFGVDNNLLPRALEAELFEPHEAEGLDQVAPELLPGTDAVTPIDRGDVCINTDLAWFEDNGVAVPTTLDQLTDPAYRGLLVVQDPTTSSPGLAFLLATVERYGDAWPDYWADLVANDVEVTAGWDEAYYGSFSGGSGEGTRPLVVSYASSPVAEVVFADPQPESSPIGTLLDSCYRQVEYAGVLRGTDQPEAARAVVDWLLSPEVQADVPLQMFVFPARADVALPAPFEQHAQVAEDPAQVDGEELLANEAAWLETWRDTVLG